MTDKVIEFPKHKVVRDVPDNVMQERARKADQKVADAIVSDLTAIMLTEMDNFDINIDEELFTKDIVLVVDALRAAVYRQFGFEHHLHPYIEKNIKIISKKDAKAMEDMTEEQIEKMIIDLIKAKELDNGEDN